MKALLWVSSVIAVLMQLSMLTCGLWIRNHGADQAGKAFHANFGIATIIVSLVTVIITMIYLLRK